MGMISREPTCLLLVRRTLTNILANVEGIHVSLSLLSQVLCNESSDVLLELQKLGSKPVRWETILPWWIGERNGHAEGVMKREGVKLYKDVEDKQCG